MAVWQDSPTDIREPISLPLIVLSDILRHLAGLAAQTRLVSSTPDPESFALRRMPMNIQ